VGNFQEMVVVTAEMVRISVGSCHTLFNKALKVHHAKSAGTGTIGQPHTNQK
jgi:hypothetical protein